MAATIEQKFEELVLEISDDGTMWARICGLVGVTVTRQAQTDSTEIPADCDDESLPLRVDRAVRSIEVSVSGEGVWAQQSHGKMMDWFYSGQAKYARIGNLNAAVGDTEYESGKAFLTQLTNQRTKGQAVSASVELQFNGTPDRIAKAA
jgi:hypothetical protein